MYLVCERLREMALLMQCQETLYKVNWRVLYRAKCDTMNSCWFRGGFWWIWHITELKELQTQWERDSVPPASILQTEFDNSRSRRSDAVLLTVDSVNYRLCLVVFVQWLLSQDIFPDIYSLRGVQFLSCPMCNYLSFLTLRPLVFDTVTNYYLDPLPVDLWL